MPRQTQKNPPIHCSDPHLLGECGKPGANGDVLASTELPDFRRSQTPPGPSGHDVGVCGTCCPLGTSPLCPHPTKDARVQGTEDTGGDLDSTQLYRTSGLFESFGPLTLTTLPDEGSPLPPLSMQTHLLQPEGSQGRRPCGCHRRPSFRATLSPTPPTSALARTHAASSGLLPKLCPPSHSNGTRW